MIYLHHENNLDRKIEGLLGNSSRYEDSVERVVHKGRKGRMEIIIRNTADLDRAAAEFLEKIGDRKLVAFFAPMGAGKTTFTTALCKVLGVTDPVGSPTFAIVNEYMRADGEPMYHFDFYRINKLQEAVEIGLYDYLDSGCLCIMEWPENIEELLPEDTLKVYFTINPDQSRTLVWAE